MQDAPRWQQGQPVQDDAPRWQQGRAINQEQVSPARARFNELYPEHADADLASMSNHELAEAFNMKPDFISQGMTLGYGDELRAGADAAFQGVGNLARRATGRPIERTMQQTYEDRHDTDNAVLEAIREARPLRAGAAEALGGVAVVPARAAQAGQVATRAGGSLLGNVGRGAAYGGTTGAVYGSGVAGRDERLEGAVGGGVAGAAFGGATPLASRALGGAVNRIRRPAVPEIDDLRAASTAAYEAVDDIGARYRPEAVQGLAARIESRLARDHLHPERHPNASGMVRRLREGFEDNAPTLTELDQWRQVVRRDVANATDPAEGHFGRMMIEEIDDFIANAGPESVIAGNADDAAAAITRARQSHQTLRKSELIENAIWRAENRSGSTGSGGNTENAIRQNLRRLIENRRTRGAFTAAERDAIQDIVRGGPVQNALRLVGKLSPQGNGLMAALGVGATAANPVLAAFPAAGMAAKHVGTRRAAGVINNLTRAVRANTPPVSSSLRDTLLGVSQNARSRLSPIAAAILAPRAVSATGTGP